MTDATAARTDRPAAGAPGGASSDAPGGDALGANADRDADPDRDVDPDRDAGGDLGEDPDRDADADWRGADGAAFPDRHPVADRRRFEIARDWIAAGGSVLIFGRPGSGKSTLLDAVADATGPVRLLRATATASDADAPFLTLARLLSSPTEAELRRLPTVHRRVLTSVATRATADNPDATPATIRHAVLELLRTLTLGGPVLLVLDDLHNADHATADVLRFVADRVDGLPIWLLAAERVPVDCPPVGRPLCPAPLLVISI